MRCPFCAHENSQVKDSRSSEDGAAIRRRRQCEACGARFTTFERIELRDLTVIKKRATANLRARQARTVITIACRKRDISPERIDRLVFIDPATTRTRGDGVESERRSAKP